MGTLDTAEAENALRDPQYSDFVIKCGDEASFNVHKFLISAKSKFLAACVKGSFREGVENELTVKETTPLALASLVFYMHSGHYNLEKVVEIWPYLRETNKFLNDVEGQDMIEDATTDVLLLASDSISQDNDGQKLRKDLDLEHLRCHLRVYELADRFMIQGLKQCSAGAIVAVISNEKSTI